MSNTNDRLDQITVELQALLEARIQELTGAMRVAERTTRQIVTTEVEIQRARATQETLAGEMAELERDHGGIRARADEVRAQHESLVTERKRLREALQTREREVREADAEIDESRRRLANLEDEAESLRRENNDLKSKIRTLEENVVRMRKLKEELMMSISGLSQQMAALNLGSKD